MFPSSSATNRTWILGNADLTLTTRAENHFFAPAYQPIAWMRAPALTYSGTAVSKASSGRDLDGTGVEAKERAAPTSSPLAPYLTAGLMLRPRWLRAGGGGGGSAEGGAGRARLLDAFGGGALRFGALFAAAGRFAAALDRGLRTGFGVVRVTGFLGAGFGFGAGFGCGAGFGFEADLGF